MKNKKRPIRCNHHFEKDDTTSSGERTDSITLATHTDTSNAGERTDSSTFSAHTDENIITEDSAAHKILFIFIIKPPCSAFTDNIIP